MMRADHLGGGRRVKQLDAAAEPTAGNDQRPYSAMPQRTMSSLVDGHMIAAALAAMCVMMPSRATDRRRVS
jgi:hypothetical protein